MSSTPAPSNAPPDDALAGARAAYAAWFAGLEAGDVGRAMASVADDVVQRNPAGETRVGRAALAAAIEAFLAAYAERVQWEITLVAVHGDEAEVRVRETTTLRAQREPQSAHS
jgi:ketosteroid isomerase-like protein